MITPNDFQKKIESEREPVPPLDAVKDLLQTFFFDADSLEEVERVLTTLSAVNNRAIVRGLAGLDSLLADPPRDGTIARLVAFDANLGLDDSSDEKALHWLREVAEMIRGVLAKTAGQCKKGPPLLGDN